MIKQPKLTAEELRILDRGDPGSFTGFSFPACHKCQRMMLNPWITPDWMYACGKHKLNGSRQVTKGRCGYITEAEAQRTIDNGVASLRKFIKSRKEKRFQ